MVLSAFVSVLLAAWLMMRWRKISRCVRQTAEPPEFIFKLLQQARRTAGIRRNVPVRITGETMSPAVCGLWRPVILLPQSLIEKLSPAQLRAVLLHELIHVRRGDVWFNCAQTLLQIVYWWHPLVWLANARLRRVREEAVDDAVMFALNEEAEIYAPTLLEVAKVALRRPLASLGIIGILESRAALRHRIERLLNFKTPGRAGLSAVWILALTVFTAVAVPMGERPDAPPPSKPDIAPAEIHAPEPVRLSQLPDIGRYFAAPGQSNVAYRLGAIRLDRVSFTNASLSEVARLLADKTMRQDPDHQGVYFALGPLPVDRSHADAFDIHSVKINFKRELTDAPLSNVLDAVVMNAERPIKYSVTGYGIEFSFRETNTVPLYTREFPIEKSPLHAVLRDCDAQVAKYLLVNLLSEAYVRPYAPKSFNYNEDSGILTVHASSNDLALTEKFLAPDNAELQGLAEARQLYEEGKTAEAQAQLQKLIASRSNHGTAVFYSRLLEQAHQRKENKLTMETPPRVGIARQLSTIIFDEIAFTNMPLRDVIRTLSDKMSDKYPVEKIDLLLQKSAASSGASGEMDLGAVKITLGRLKNVRLMEVLSKIITGADWPITYSIQDYGITFSFSDAQSDLHMRTFLVNSNALYSRLEQLGLHSTDAAGLMQNLFTATSISITPPKTFFYNPPQGGVQGTLTVRGSTEDLDRIERALARDLNPMEAAILLYQRGDFDEAAVKFQKLAAANPDNKLALYYLNRIEQTQATNGASGFAFYADNFSPAPADRSSPGGPNGPVFPGAPTPSRYEYTQAREMEIFRELNSITLDDTALTKLSFANTTLKEVVRIWNKEGRTLNPEHEGLLFGLKDGDSEGGVDIGAVKINMPRPPRDIRLRNFIEDLVTNADHKITYSLADYGVAFSFPHAEVPPMHTRMFKLDMKAFTQNFGPVTSPEEFQAALVKSFQKSGVNMNPPASVFFNSRATTLTVRASATDLEFIERLIQSLNSPVPEVTIKARFVEIDGNDRHLDAAFKKLLTGGDAKDTNDIRTGILTDPQLRQILQTLDKREGANLLNEGEVTTLSGRQANFQIVDVKTFPVDVTTTITNNQTNRDYKMITSPFGSTLDVLPTVSADGYNVTMSVTPTVTEFLGYENPKEFAKYDKDLKNVVLPLPKSRVRKTTTTATVWDGQTLVIGNLSDEQVLQGPNGIEVRQPFLAKKKKQLLVFITPTLIDPSGNRLHSRDYYDDGLVR